MALARREHVGAERPVISLLVPSRQRPDSLTGMWATATETASHDIELIYRVDDDDPTLDRYMPEDGNVKRLVGPREHMMTRYWNECAAVAHGEILMHCGDDVRFRTADWDTQVIDAFDLYPDRIAFVYGRDGVHDANLGTHGFLHRRWVDAVGFFLPPYFSSDWADTWLNDVAQAIGRRHFVPAIYTEHMHPVVGKGEWDITHQERLERGRQDDVDALYVRLAPEREEWADKLRSVMVDGLAR